MEVRTFPICGTMCRQFATVTAGYHGQTTIFNRSSRERRPDGQDVRGVRFGQDDALILMPCRFSNERPNRTGKMTLRRLDANMLHRIRYNFRPDQ
ncbi:MAG: hypothetical protein AVDCRST_MAG93-9703 [uncultured Chloroflexia bacterium]|uniref:Uncharacterized protein n=1 Tax=uncultured Chloroflexia bacterium TaxID=1672391 RepID=A0A6J4NK35_9CHLR|nr:MAG: hypothetical protein AVDCRST_MAG93-9703 [uncultured Chloroflexia bacterium]